MILIVIFDLVITLGLALSGLLLAFVLVLAGLPEWLLWVIPTFFGCFMPAHRFYAGYDAQAWSRRGRRPDHAQRPIAPQPRRREPRLEDLYP